MPTRYKHGLAVCYACDRSDIGQCTICFTGLCQDHSAPNTLDVWICPSCKADVFKMVYQETAQWLRKQRWYIAADFRGLNDGIRIYGRSNEMLYDLLADLNIEEEEHGK